jgi:hypothetical protein
VEGAVGVILRFRYTKSIWQQTYSIVQTNFI